MSFYVIRGRGAWSLGFKISFQGPGPTCFFFQNRGTLGILGTLGGKNHDVGPCKGLYCFDQLLSPQSCQKSISKAGTHIGSRWGSKG